MLVINAYTAKTLQLVKSQSLLRKSSEIIILAEQFAMERCVCELVLVYNRESEERMHKGFSLSKTKLTGFCIYKHQK